MLPSQRDRLCCMNSQITIVLQSFLKIVVREQLVQIARLRRIRQPPELPEPAVVRVLIGAQQVGRAVRRHFTWAIAPR